jgi:hypothetical protein
MSVRGATGGGDDVSIEAQGELNAPDAAPPGDPPGTVASGEASVGASVGADLAPVTDIAQKLTKKPDIGAQFADHLDQNLIVGMAHVDASGGAKVGPDGVAADAKASGTFQLPFVGAPSLGQSIAAAAARAEVTRPASDTDAAKMSGTRGSFTDTSTRGIELASAPPGNPGAAALGATAAKDVGGGPAIWKAQGAASAEAVAWKTADGFDTSGAAGEVAGGYEVAAAKLDAQVQGGVTVTAAGVDAKGAASAGFSAIDATGRISYTTPSLVLDGVPLDGKVSATAHANVGAEAHARGEVAIEPAAGRLYAGGEIGASASAKLDAQATATLEYQDEKGAEKPLASVTADGYVQAGVSAEAHARLGYDDGTITFDVGASVAWGVGAGYDVKGSVNVKNIAGAVVDGVDHATDGAVTAVEEEGEEAVRGVEHEAREVGDGVEGNAKILLGATPDVSVTWATPPAAGGAPDPIAGGLASGDPAQETAALASLRQLAPGDRLAEARAALVAASAQCDDATQYAVGVRIGLALGKDAVDSLFEGGGPAVGALAKYVKAGAALGDDIRDVPDQDSPDAATRGAALEKALADAGAPPFAGTDPAALAARVGPEVAIASQVKALAKTARFPVSESDSTAVLHAFFRASQAGTLPSLLSALDAAGKLGDVIEAGSMHNRGAIADLVNAAAPAFAGSLPR